jgi:methyl-accepting chemotaxis protein
MEDFKRRSYFIDKTFQTKFIVKFSLIVVIASLFIGGFLFFLLKHFTVVATENISSAALRTPPDFIIPVVMETISIVIALAALSVIFLTVFTWHKIDGPLFRLNNEIKKLKDGDLKANFTIRSSDQLKELSTSLTEMSGSWAARHSALKKKIGELKVSLQDTGESKEAVLKKINELEEILSYFKA